MPEIAIFFVFCIGNIVNEVNTTVKAIEGLTEDLFFSKPILNDKDLQSVVSKEQV